MNTLLDKIITSLDTLDNPAMEERAAIVAWLRGAINRGYRAVNPTGGVCEHGTYTQEDCIACYEDQLLAALDAIESGQHREDRS